MGGCSSRPQVAPPVPQMPQAPPVPEDTPQVVISNILQADTPQVVTPQVEEAIQRALANESKTELRISTRNEDTPLTVNDARSIIACLENPRFDTLCIIYYSLHNPAVLNIFRDGLPLCTAVTTVILHRMNLSNEDLDCLRPAFYSTSVTKLDISYNHIQGQRGGEVLRDLLRGNNSVVELILEGNPIGPEGAIGFGQGLSDTNRLHSLNLRRCNIGNDGLANLLPAGGIINNSLTNLKLSQNGIQGADGGRQVSLLLQCFQQLKELILDNNSCLGPLGAQALAPGLAAARHLERLELFNCGLENNGVVNLVPDGQVNRTLTYLNLSGNTIQGLVGGDNVVALAARCTNLDRLAVYNSLSPDKQRHLDMLLVVRQASALVRQASALGGSTFPVLFRFMEKAHRHEQGLSAIFVILQNDGDDYFCTALNRAME